MNSLAIAKWFEDVIKSSFLGKASTICVEEVNLFSMGIVLDQNLTKKIKIDQTDLFVQNRSTTFAPKRIMSNPAFMSVCFEGEQRELRSLYGKMKRLQERKKPLVENSFYYPTRWLGNLVIRLGADWHDVYCRGT